MINMGIFGTGMIAKVMADTVNKMKESGNFCTELYGIASRTPEKAQEFAEKYGVCKAYASYEELAQDPEIDFIYIAVPHSHHYETAKLAIENGKHVLCEKAFTVNAAQAKALFALAKEKKVLLAEAIWPRYMPTRKLIQEVMDEKLVGEVNMLSANLGYPMKETPRIKYPHLAGGALMDVGIYALNFAEMVFGHPDEVHAAAVMNEYGVDVQNSFTLTYKDTNRMAVLFSCADCTTDRNGIIQCSQGYIRVQNINNPEMIKVYNNHHQVIKEIPCPPQLTGYEYEVMEAAEMIEKGELECPSMPASETIHMMEVMDEIRRQIGLEFPAEIESC